MFTTVVGLNHKTTPIDVRESLYLGAFERELLLSELKNDPCVVEAIVLSTCNRTEIYANLINDNPELLLKILLRLKNLPLNSDFKKYFYIYQGSQAIAHLLKVSAGLDSLILGEKQILGQIREAVELSRKKGMLGKSFNILSNIAIRAGKKARTETQIDCGGSSISWAAVTMAQKLLGTLQDKSVLIIGAGKMGRLAVDYLRNKGVANIYVTNRTHETAIALAKEFDATAVAFWDMKEFLSKVDVCICSASAPHYLIEKDLVETAMAGRQERKLVCIDISMPRNINPEISSLKNVSLVAIDDLDKVVEDNTKKRLEAVEEVERIVSAKVNEFYSKLAKTPVIAAEDSYQAVMTG